MYTVHPVKVTVPKGESKTVYCKQPLLEVSIFFCIQKSFKGCTVMALNPVESPYVLKLGLFPLGNKTSKTTLLWDKAEMSCFINNNSFNEACVSLETGQVEIIFW